jgi:hypothetical protein
MSSVYYKGAVVRCSGSFTQNGVAVDPATVKFKFTTPGGATTTYTYGADGALVKDSTGHYHVDVSASEFDRWIYRWESTGTAQAAQEAEFFVKGEF